MVKSTVAKPRNEKLKGEIFMIEEDARHLANVRQMIMTVN